MANNEVSSTHAALMELSERFPAQEELGMAPVELERTYANASAYVHALRLAFYEHPEAFGRSYRTLPAMQTRFTFENEDVTTYGIGEDHQLQAAISVHEPTISRYFPKPRIPSIEYLFKHDSLKSLDVGRSLAGAAMTKLVESGHDEIKIMVTDSNPVMRRLYERFGFVQTSTFRGANGKLFELTLKGHDELVRVQQKLTNQV